MEDILELQVFVRKNFNFLGHDNIKSLKYLKNLC